ncbi:MAG: zinc ribbon domain-containing protein [Thermodesulfobacteriota bacterium]
MAIYEYEHLEEPCAFGKIFEFPQSMKDEPLTLCPKCEGPVRRLISRPSISIPKSDRDLRDKGFTKLVKRDDGVYENVTARDGESRYMVRDRPETLPDVTKVVTD